MSVKFHTLRMMKMAAVVPGGEEIEIWCVFVDVQRGRGNVWWGWEVQVFIINYTVGPSEKKN